MTVIIQWLEFIYWTKQTGFSSFPSMWAEVEACKKTFCDLGTNNLNKPHKER